MDLFSMQPVFQTNFIVGYVYKIQSKSDKRAEAIKDHLWTWSCGCNFDVLYPVDVSTNRHAHKVKLYANLCSAGTLTARDLGRCRKQ